MNTKRYQLRITGLREAEGQIKAATLQRVLDGLLTTAERTTRLLATGKGSEKGTKPKWLDATIDFTIAELAAGSTTLEIEAPQLRSTAREAFAQQEFWREMPSLDDTALDLAAFAIDEIRADDPSGDRFDTSVLQAIVMFKRAVGKDVCCELNPRGSARGRFLLDERTCDRVQDQLKRIPKPRAFIVSGRLDEITHGSGRFCLVTGQRLRLLGRLEPSSLDIEMLRPLWGRQTTVEGMVHFKANGQPRFIEARRISGQLEGDSVFEEMPLLEIPESRGLDPVRREQAWTFDPITLAGAWPSDEPIEDLLADLD